MAQNQSRRMSSRASPRGSVSAAEREVLEHERTIIRDGLLRNMRIGDVRYLIPEKWHHQWKKYVGMGGYGHSRGDPTMYPGRIDLATLVDENGELKRDLVEMRDFRLVPEDSWKILVRRYGLSDKSPDALPRNVILVRNKDNFSVEAIELYPLDITVRPHWELSRASRMSFSRLTTLEQMNQNLRSHYDISADAETRLWRQVDASTGAMELLPESKGNDITLLDLGICEGQQLVIIEKRSSKSEPWPSTAPDFAREATDVLGVNTLFRTNSLSNGSNVNASQSGHQSTVPPDQWE